MDRYVLQLTEKMRQSVATCKGDDNLTERREEERERARAKSSRINFASESFDRRQRRQRKAH